MLSYAEAMAEVMWHLVTHDSHGYSQPNRAGDGTVETFRLSDNTLVSVHGGDYDCSEAVRSCVAALGLIAWDYAESYMWTGNERGLLAKAGFVQINPASARIGDILWTPGHTEMVVGGYGGKLYQAGFRIAETGGIDGAKGDQTGKEATYSAYKPHQWTVALRYAGRERNIDLKAESKPANQIGEDMECVIRLNGDEKKPLVYFDGCKLRKINHPDELKALQDVYRLTHGGREIPMFPLGTAEAPFGTRLAELVGWYK